MIASGRVSFARGLLATILTVAVTVPVPLSSQQRGFVYISNVTGTMDDDRPLTTIEDQTRSTLAHLGEALSAHGLDYGDVVVSNVFLKDTRHFQAMNGIYRTVFSSAPPTRATVRADLPDPDALIQISVVATRSPKEIIAPSGMRSPALPYSWGIKVGSTLFIAGATSRSPETYDPVTGDVATQTRRIFGNIGLVLDEAGMSYGDLTSCKVFLDDTRGYGGMNEAYAEAVTDDDPPARAAVRAGLMNPLFSSEIQCVAEASQERRVVLREGQQQGRLPLSPAISTGERLYLSGMLARGADVQEEARNVLESMRATLGAANLDFTHVVDVWVYLTDVRDAQAVQEVLDEMLPAGAPTPTVIGTPLVARRAVEIQMTAAR